MMKKMKRVQDNDGVGKELRRPDTQAESGGRLGGFLGSELKEPLGSPRCGRTEPQLGDGWAQQSASNPVLARPGSAGYLAGGLCWGCTWSRSGQASERSLGLNGKPRMVQCRADQDTAG